MTDERLLGMQQLAKELSLSVLVKMVIFGAAGQKSDPEICQKKDVVVCASDLMAIGAMKALIKMDIFRPVCGFDGIILMGYVGKQMNTVSQNFPDCPGKPWKSFPCFFREKRDARSSVSIHW